jgi:hypothetical protein
MTQPPTDSVVVHGGAAGFAQDIRVGAHRLQADEPTGAGGTDTGPSPYICNTRRSMPRTARNAKPESGASITSNDGSNWLVRSTIRSASGCWRSRICARSTAR